MSNETDVTIKVDDRIRLMCAALAATNFPETAQSQKRHQPHAHARATAKYLRGNRYNQHPAIQSLQALLDQGTPLEALFTLVMLMDWPSLKISGLPKWAPPNWNEQLGDFYETAKLGDFWANDDSLAWNQAESQATNAFAKIQFKGFLQNFVGEIQEELIFVPNVGYPADRELGLRVQNDLIAIIPPTLAWGESPPWPYDEETMLTQSYRAALTQYSRLLLLAYLRNNADKVAEATQKELPVNDQFKATYPTWEDQFITLFVAGAVAVYLEDYINTAEAKAYILMEKKARGMTILPGTVSVLRRFLQEVGNRYETLADFLSVFPSQLRVAKKIVTM